MKIRNEYSRDFKRLVVKTYYESEASLQQVAENFNIKSGAIIHRWLRIFGDEFNPLVMKKKKVQDLANSSREIPNEELQLRIKELEQALEREKLRSFALDKMIDIAERDLNVSIRKKSGAKQSGK